MMQWRTVVDSGSEGFVTCRNGRVWTWFGSSLFGTL